MSGRERVLDILLGAFVGGLVGAVIAVNVIITAGIGYDVTLAQVFRESVVVGIVTISILVAGPIVGAIAMRRSQRRRRGGNRDTERMAGASQGSSRHDES